METEVQRPPRRSVQILGIGLLSVAMFGFVQAAIWVSSGESERLWAPFAEGMFFLGLGLASFVRRPGLQNKILILCGGASLVGLEIETMRTGERGITPLAVVTMVGLVVVFIHWRRKQSESERAVAGPTAAERFVIARTLWRTFDPLASSDSGEPTPPDEYDEFAEESAKLLAGGVSIPELIEYVRKVCEEWLQLEPKSEVEYEEFAKQLKELAGPAGEEA